MIKSGKPEFKTGLLNNSPAQPVKVSLPENDKYSQLIKISENGESPLLSVQPKSHKPASGPGSLLGYKMWMRCPDKHARAGIHRLDDVI